MRSEADIIQACIKGDRAAQELLFKLHSGYMMGICLRYAGNTEDARDLLHDGFIKVFQILHQFKGNSALKTWMSHIFVNLSIDYLRKRNRRIEVSTDDFSTEPYVDDENPTQVDELAQLDVEDVLALVQQLPEKYRLVINLYSVDGFSHKEIGAMLDISEGTSKSQLSRARKLLLGQLTKKKLSYETAQA